MSAPPSTGTKLLSGLSGVAGEYFVAAELSRRGYIASITLRNTRGIDILATNAAGTRSVTIQCKTNQGSDATWVMHEKAEAFVAENHFYAFVALGDVRERPRFHVAPSYEVARYVSDYHRTWLSTPGRRGRERKDTTMRSFHDPADKYRERWDLLGLG